MERKDRILKYMQDRYKRGQWALFSMIELRRAFGNDIRNELNELYREGYIEKRAGINQPNIELIKFD